ncbi:hypothetical protein [Virgibacillus proomii]|uniref:hypothetical protein n=1 Tax=Virgibacillus proomii TaxID=84407 RepID=UPI001C100AB0|nr:hypothetical protein [Virgibacillus proomii]MBU5266870.1 hypothetical protein [Virgibacillus proomii]
MAFLMFIYMAHSLIAWYMQPGVACAILLPILKYNADDTQEKYRDIAKVIGVKLLNLLEAKEAAMEAVAH